MTQGESTHKPLPAELVTLLQYVELNNAGWWDRAAERLVLWVLWVSERLTTGELEATLSREFGLNAANFNVERHLAKLEAEGTLIAAGDGVYKLSEASRLDFERRLKEDEEITDTARRTFVRLILKACPTVDPNDAWDYLLRDVLGPLVKQLGARTFDFITGAKVNQFPDVRFANYLKHFNPDDQEAARAAVVDFLNPNDSAVRSFVLKHLSAYFVLESASLDSETLAAITRITAKKPTFKVLLDTNFVFSFLGLHDNPANEASAVLIVLTEQLKQIVDITLYVLPRTLAEARASLISNQTALSGLVLTRNLARAASRVKLSGLATKYVETARQTGRAQTAEQYFEPYINNLLGLLREQGVELLNQDTSDLAVAQPVVNDILAQVDFEKKTRGERAKNYERVEHDVILWHVVQGRRFAWVESPLAAVWWVATLDYRFMGFDAFKARRQQQLPICLHPVALVEMLQFWMPRSPQLEEALLSNLRLPLLFYDFDPVVEKATISILRTLSRFEGSERLSEETISNILVNEELRRRMILETDEEEQVRIVRDAIVEEDEKVRSEVVAARKNVEQLESQVLANEETIVTLENKMAKSDERATDRFRRLSDKLESATARLERTRFNILIVLPVLLAAICVGSVLGWALLRIWHVPYFLPLLFSYGISVIAGEELLYLRAKRNPVLSTQRFWILTGRLRRFSWGAVLAVALSAIGSALWELLKSRLG
jgi:hypothetical protein